MTLKGNKLVQILVVVIVIASMLIIIKSCSSGSSGSKNSQAKGAAGTDRDLTPEEMMQLGISDTPQDTVATLVGRVNQLQASNQERDERMQKLVEENSKLAKQATDVRAQVREEMKNSQSTTEAQNNGLLARLQDEVETLTNNRRKGNSGNNNDYPVGLGLEGTDGSSGDSGYHWVKPMDAKEETNTNGQPTGNTSFPSAFNDTSFGEAGKDVDDATGGQDVGSHIKGKHKRKDEEENVDPRYTIPENSTLMGSLSMTALLGRVPVDGTVNDPYPFKALIGRDNLAANGIEIPEVQAAVVSGKASGDWTLSCVRGSVESMTFIFEDGTIRTLPEPENGRDDSSSSKDSDSNNRRIGWISDDHGLPCISGMRRSNAQQYLGTQSLLTAAGAGAAALMSDSDGGSSTTMNTDGSITQAMNGQQAVDQIMSQGVGQMSKWVNQLYGEAFAAVYVPPGQHVSIHIDKELRIDYEKEGRKVRYDTNAGSVTNELD
ncbi:TIGR03752 family integrating conjugative element protein [Carnimonas bestiolae]|uniref:TIGR03752 family integrating conjugative element protein n=1 Tax=Carnimonas bestiolae TaxID=3402172 RepID=UPI003EDCAF5F